MLNEKDLRIGNWVDGIREGAFSMIENGADIELALHEGLPIRITDHILEGIGFEMKDYRIIDAEESHQLLPAYYDGYEDQAICQNYQMNAPHHGIIELRKYDCDVIEIYIRNQFASFPISRVNAFHLLQNVFWNVFFLEIGLKEIEE